MKDRSRAQIVATLGPASNTGEKICALAKAGMDAARLNFSWGDFDEHREQIEHIRFAEQCFGTPIVIIMDVPGPRIQEVSGHTYDRAAVKALTDHDRECISFGIGHNVDYVALSFVGNAADVEEARGFIEKNGGKQKIIAKIERQAALDNLEEILSRADGLMVARGDLGNEVPLEKIPFVQADIVKLANKAGKPVIVATQMMLSMTESPTPTRAEVTDVEAADMEGADAVMLSEESAKGKYPVEAVAMMEKALVEAEKHMGPRRFNLLEKLS